MLRDVPRLYFMLFGLVAAIVILGVWYFNMYQRESDMLVLNEAVITAAVSEVDESARLDEGVLLLAPTFESVAWDAIVSEYPAGSKVQFDYMFRTNVPRYSGIPSKTVSSPVYEIGDSVNQPTEATANPMIGRPIEYIRVKLRDSSDTLDVWTYVSTVAVDAISVGE